MSKCFIGLGKCSHFYLFILSYVISRYLNYIILQKSCITKKSYFIHSLCRYFSYLCLGIVFLIIFTKNLNKTKKNTLSVSKIVENNNRSDKLLIFNNRKRLKTSEQNEFLFFIISLIYALYTEILQMLNYFGFYPIEIWSFDIIFVIVFMYLYYPKNTYKHQIYSLIFVSIINTFLLISASLVKNYNNNTQNIYQNKGYIICTFGMIIYLSITFLIYYARMNAKDSMDNNFISPYKIIIAFGIIGFILESAFFIIAYLLFNNKKCHNNNEISFFCYFSINIIERFSELFKINGLFKCIVEIIYMIIFIFSCFVSIMSELFIIKDLNPSYILISENLYYELVKLYEFVQTEDRHNTSKTFIILQFAQLFEFFGCLIYLEIFELKFCELNKNLKKSISQRSEEDFMDAIALDDESVSSKENNNSLISEDGIDLIEIK